MNIHRVITHLVLQQSLWTNDLIKDVFSYMSINSGQRVIQQVDRLVTVDSSGQAHSLLLTSRQIYSLNERETQRCRNSNLKTDGPKVTTCTESTKLLRSDKINNKRIIKREVAADFI